MIRRLSDAARAVIVLVVVALLTVSLVAAGAASPSTPAPVSVPVLPPVVSIDPTLPNLSTLSPRTAAPTAVTVSSATTRSARVTPARRPVVAPPSWARCPQWWKTAQRAGWPVDELGHLDYVMWRESRCVPTASNDVGFGHTGLVQISTAHLSTPRYAQLCAATLGRICTRSDLLRPRLNLRAARLLFLTAERWFGCGWQPWRTRTWAPC